MNAKQIKSLLDAGIEPDVVDRLIALDAEKPEDGGGVVPAQPVNNPAPVPAPAPAFDYDLLGKAINDAMKPVIEQMQAAALNGTSQPKEQSIADIIGEIINPPNRKG